MTVHTPPGALDKPGDARRRAQASFDEAVARQREYDQKPTIESAARLAAAISQAQVAAEEAHQEWESGWVDDQHLERLAGPAYDDVPDHERDAYAEEVSYLLSHPAEHARLLGEDGNE